MNILSELPRGGVPLIASGGDRLPDASSAYGKQLCEIAASNQLYNELVDSHAVTTPEYRSAVVDHLTELQQTALATLLSEGTVAYDKDKISYIENAERITSELDAISELCEGILSRLAMERVTITDRIPVLAEKLDALHPEAELLRTSNLRRQELEEELATLDAEYASLYGAWTIPRLVDPHEVYEKDEVLYVDTFPAGDDLDRIIESVRGARTYKGRVPDASELAAIAIATVPGYVLTAREIGQLVYPVEEDLSEKASKAAALMSVNLCSHDVRILEKYCGARGLVPQRGERQYLRIRNGVAVPYGRKIYVYRAVPQAVVDNGVTRAAASDGGQPYVDIWE